MSWRPPQALLPACDISDIVPSLGLCADFNFLEEVKRAEDVASRTKPPTPCRHLPAYLATLMQQAGHRSTRLLIMAPGEHAHRPANLPCDPASDPSLCLSLAPGELASCPSIMY